MISQSTLPYEALPLAANYVDRTRRKIEDIRGLLPGWRYGQGVKFDNRVLEVALELNSFAKELLLFETDVFPFESGDLLLTVYFGDHHLELTIDRNAMIDIAVNKNDDEIKYVEGQTVEQVKEDIKEFRKLVWKRSDLFIGGTTIGERGDFKVQHSLIQVMVPGFRYLTKSVQLEKVKVFATISSDTTPLQPQVRPSTGASTPRYSLAVAS
jgi:hypothetical protein